MQNDKAQQSEQDVQQEQSKNEADTVNEINRIFEGLALAVFALPLFKIYFNRREALPISDTPTLAALSKSIDSAIEKALPAIYSVIHRNGLKSWKIGEKQGYVSLIGKVPGNAMLSLIDKGVFAHRDKAAADFIERTTKGLKLSDRVWRLKQPLKIQIETTIQLAIHEGKAAIQVANDLKQYLKNPDPLFSKTKNAGDKLKISQAARLYRPGVGVYRSPIKNAHRLARNEINKAYRNAEWAQMQDLPFVTGYRIKTSNNHPVPDICDTLKGLYPKDFKWSGWHVMCRCHMVKELISPEEFARMQAGAFTPAQTNEYPHLFKEWCRDNKARIKPVSGIDWIEDNSKVLAIFGEKAPAMPQ